MRKAAIGILLMLFAAAAFGAYSGPSEIVNVKINESVMSDGVTIEFLELIDDSRCPVDVNCIWAGTAKIKVKVSEGERSEVTELDLMHRSSGFKFGEHVLRFTGLSPVPRSNVRINRNEYVATFDITKAEAETASTHKCRPSEPHHREH